MPLEEPRKATSRLPRSEANSSEAPVSNSNLGERISILFRISGDDEHPFSEVTGVLQRVEERVEMGRRLHVLRRSGEVVEVAEHDIVKLKLIPAGKGAALRAPGAWEKGG